MIFGRFHRGAIRNTKVHKKRWQHQYFRLSQHTQTAPVAQITEGKVGKCNLNKSRVLTPLEDKQTRAKQP